MMQQDPLAHLCPEKPKTGCDPETCWCLPVQLTDQSRQSLKAQTNGKRCLCQSCIEKIAQAQQ